MQVLRFSAVALVVVATALTVGGHAEATGICTDNPNNKFSVTCIKADMLPGPWGGAYARWESKALNISQPAALAGGFLEHTLWLYSDYTIQPDGTCPTCTWLEIGDSAGFANQWWRWFYWVDGTTGYVEHAISQAPNDNAWRSYEIQWEGSGVTQGWKLYLNGSQVGGYSSTTPIITWKAPNLMANQRASSGLEATNSAFYLSGGNSNSNTGTDTFNVTPLQLRSVTCCTWWNWPSNYADVDGPQPCPASPPYACYNGENATTGPATWNSNKPR